MEIDRQNLIKLLEVFVDTTHVFELELMLYQLVYLTYCKTKGLEPEQAEELVNQTRKLASPKLRETTEAGYRSLVGKLPQIVDLLDSNRDAALRLLQEWKPKGPPN